MMNAQEIIAYIGAAEKKTPVKVYINEREPIDYGAAQVFGEGRSRVVFGDWRELGPLLAANAERIADMAVENDRRNSAIPLLDMALALYSDGTTFGSTGIEAYTPQGG